MIFIVITEMLFFLTGGNQKIFIATSSDIVK